MVSGPEGGHISLLKDTSEAAVVQGGRSVLDFSGIRYDPHEINTGAILGIISNGSGHDGSVDSLTYTVRSGEYPSCVCITPPLQQAAQEALQEYFGVPVIDVDSIYSVG